MFCVHCVQIGLLTYLFWIYLRPQKFNFNTFFGGGGGGDSIGGGLPRVSVILTLNSLQHGDNWLL